MPVKNKKGRCNEMKKKIYAKKDLEWYLAELYFFSFVNSVKGKIADDLKFQEMCREILNYITKKTTPTTGEDITDTFVVVEQEITER